MQPFVSLDMSRHIKQRLDIEASLLIIIEETWALIYILSSMSLPPYDADNLWTVL